MNIEKFELEWWLNPLDAVATYNMGSSCCKPLNMQELFELTGVSQEETFDELAHMSLHYGYFEGMPRLREAFASMFETPAIAAENIMVVHGGTSANALTCYALCESPITELLTAIVIEHKEALFARNHKICEEGRAALKEWLQGQPHFHLACQSHGSTSFLTYDWDIPTKEFCEDLFEKTGALVCHGMCFGIEHGFRIGYGYGDVEYFKAGLAKLGEYAASLPDDLLR